MESTELTIYTVNGMDFPLQHYGVKGMKWGVRRNRNAVNKDYTAKQRKHDRTFYGKGGEKRINKRLNEGHGLRGARHYEAERKEKNEKLKRVAKKGAKKVANVMSTIGTYYMIDQVFYGGAGTRIVKETAVQTGRAAITGILMAMGRTDIKWYDKQGWRVG